MRWPVGDLRARGLTPVMKAAPALPLEQHNVEIQRNQQAWQRKPMLREIYHAFYRQIAARIDPSIPGAVVELGSSAGRGTSDSATSSARG